MSIGGMPPPSHFSRKSSFLGPNNGRESVSCAESELMSNLEKSRIEYENAKAYKDKEERTKQEQQLVNTIEMKETIENLNEELLVKNEVLAKYENHQTKSEEEVSNTICFNFLSIL